MSRITLAFGSFFRLLFGGKLHPSAADYLPESARPKLPPADTTDDKPKKDKPQDAKGKGDSERPEKAPKADKPKPQSKPERKTSSASEHHRDGALALLALLQREGRLIDFLREDLDDYEDEDIGASVRDIHRGCRKVLEDHLQMEPVMPGEEDEDVTVPKGFDPGEVRLVGDIEGEPPFKGVMRHHGWRVTSAKLPKLTDGVDRHVLAPAEVEIS